jgi:hypothetical protein
MAAFVLTDSRIIVGSTDISSFSGAFQSESSVNMVEFTPFGAGGFVRKIPGLQSHSDSFSGAADYDAGGVSAVFNSSSLGEQDLITVMPTGGATAGDPAQFTRGLITSLNAPGGSVGDLATFDMATTSDTTKVFGQVAAPLALRSSTLTGSVLTMAGPTASQRLYIGVNLTAATSTATMVVTVQSATLVGFGSPTLRATLPTTVAATPGWQFVSVAGPITDGFWRATLTYAGSGNLTSSVVIGVA